MKRIATFIAIGSILTGIIVCFWPPEPCQDGPSVLPCLNGFAQIMYGYSIIVGGIVLLILIPIANLRHRVLAMIGVILSFVIAIGLFGNAAFGIHFPAVFWMLELIATPLKVILGIGFLLVALSANIIKEYHLNQAQP